MTSILFSWFVLSLVVWLTALVVPGVKINGMGGAVVTAAFFGALNWALGWFLFVLIGIGTLGIGFLLAFLTRWIVNAIVLKITAALTKNLEIDSFKSAFLGGLCISLLSTAVEHYLK